MELSPVPVITRYSREITRDLHSNRKSRHLVPREVRTHSNHCAPKIDRTTGITHNGHNTTLSFSIDSLTGDAATYRSQYEDAGQYYSTGPGYPSHRTGNQMKPEYPDNLDGRTPSPIDSGIDGSFSLTAYGDSYNDIEKALSKLSKKSETLVKPEVGHDKPPHSYIALITMAIQSCPDRKLVLSDIYRYVMDNFPYYNNGERAWRISIRYTLSINGCFTKAGRSDCGKGNYWTVDPAVADDFAKGDYRRRQPSRRRSRRNVKSSSGDIDLSTTRITSAPSGYHPYSTVAYYPRTTYRVPAATDRQQTTPDVPGYSPSTTTPTGTTSLVYTPNGTTSPAYTPNLSPSPGYTPNATTSPGYTPNATSPGYTPTATTSSGYTSNATTPLGYTPNATTPLGYTPTEITAGYTSGYSDFYQNYYALPTSQPSPSYDIMASNKYDYSTTSGFHLPANQSYVF